MIELLLLFIRISLLNIVLFIKALCSLLPDHLVVLLVLAEDVRFALLVLYWTLAFHFCIFLFQHFVIKILFHSKLHHRFIPFIVLFTGLSHPKRLFPGLLYLLKHPFLLLLQHLNPILHQLRLYRSRYLFILCLKQGALLTQFRFFEGCDVWWREGDGLLALGHEGTV